MLKKIKKHCFQSSMILILLFSSVQIQAAMLVWSPPETSPSIGQSFALTLQGSGFTEGSSGGGVNVSWDSRIISLNSVVISSVFEDSAAGLFALNDIGPVSIDSNNIASIFVAATSFFGTGLTDFDVADFLFTAVTPGQTAVTIVSLNLVSDPWASVDLASVYDIDIGNVSSVVTVVPLPPAVLLFASSLIGMLSLSRRKMISA